MDRDDTAPLMLNDAELLERYANAGSEAAFRELVDRHIGLVYSAALRQVGGDAPLAHDVAQGVFTDLARKARSLSRHPSLTGWLFTSTRFAAAKAVRSERRRQRHEKEAQAMDALQREATPDWRQISPEIDAVIAELSAPEREAMLLRFFRGQSFAEIGRQIAVDQDTARARVQRALEKLRAKLQRRGITSTAEALAIALAANGATAAPAGSGATIAATAIAAVKAGAAGAAGASLLSLMSTKTLVVVTTGLALALAYVGSIAWRQHVMLQTAAMERSTATLDRERVHRLEAENRDLRSQIAAMQTTAAPAVAQDAANQPFVDELDRWLQRIDRLKAFGAAHPGFMIPEMKSLTVADWLGVTRDKSIRTEADYRIALANLRLVAKQQTAQVLATALKAYLSANNGQMPPDTTALAAFLPSGTDPAILGGYTVNHSGLVDVPADPVWDSRVSVMGNGTVAMRGCDQTSVPAMETAIAKYRLQTGGEPTDVAQLIPFMDAKVASKKDAATLAQIFAALQRTPKLGTIAGTH